jgi:hypothetical protein
LDNVVASGSKDKTVRLWLPTVCVIVTFPFYASRDG